MGTWASGATSGSVTLLTLETTDARPGKLPGPASPTRPAARRSSREVAPDHQARVRLCIRSIPSTAGPGSALGSRRDPTTLHHGSSGGRSLRLRSRRASRHVRPWQGAVACAGSPREVSDPSGGRGLARTRKWLLTQQYSASSSHRQSLSSRTRSPSAVGSAMTARNGTWRQTKPGKLRGSGVGAASGAQR